MLRAERAHLRGLFVQPCARQCLLGHVDVVLHAQCQLIGMLATSAVGQVVVSNVFSLNQVDLGKLYSDVFGVLHLMHSRSSRLFRLRSYP
jgi:hypothetical protein